MKKVLLSIMLLAVAHKSEAMNQSIVLPSQQELSSRLCSLELHYFVEKTKIDQTLGGRKLYPLGVVNVINLALYNYSIIAPEAAASMAPLIPMIIKKILEDHPQAIESLKQDKVL